MNATASEGEAEMINTTRDATFRRIANELGLGANEDFGTAGRYAPLVGCDNQIFVSGQLPKLSGEIAVRGLIGADVSVDSGRRAAMICAARCLALLQQSLGTLDHIRTIPRIGVYMQSDHAFEEQSTVADGASEVLHSVFGAAGTHARTSLSVFRLPRYAAVEVDLIAIVWQEFARDWSKA